MFCTTLSDFSVVIRKSCLHIVAANRDTSEIKRTTVNHKRGLKTSTGPNWIAIMQLNDRLGECGWAFRDAPHE